MVLHQIHPLHSTFNNVALQFTVKPLEGNGCFPRLACFQFRICRVCSPHDIYEPDFRSSASNKRIALQFHISPLGAFWLSLNGTRAAQIGFLSQTGLPLHRQSLLSNAKFIESYVRSLTYTLHRHAVTSTSTDCN